MACERDTGWGLETLPYVRVWIRDKGQRQTLKDVASSVMVMAFVGAR